MQIKDFDEQFAEANRAILDFILYSERMNAEARYILEELEPQCWQDMEVQPDFVVDTRPYGEMDIITRS